MSEPWWDSSWKINVSYHAIKRARERVGSMTSFEAHRFLRRRVRRAIAQASLSPVPPGWVESRRLATGPDVRWVDTTTDRRVALLVRKVGPKELLVVTVMTPR